MKKAAKQQQYLAPLFMIGGTDGSGKGYIVDTLTQLCREENLNVFDHRTYQKDHTHIIDGVKCIPVLPSPEQISKYNVVVTAEPTYTEVGYAVRELLKNKHAAQGIAEGFSFDRYNLSKRLILPARINKIPVIEERGFESSFTYQYELAKYQKEQLSIEKIMDLYGNQFTFKAYPPSHIVICHCPVDVSIDRLANRDKKDDAIYEKKKDFMQAVLDRYLSTELKELFESQGIKVIYIDTDTTLEGTTNLIKEKVWPELHELITKNHNCIN